jgi:4-hydroxybenzoate polyprenyltransferase
MTWPASRDSEAGGLPAYPGRWRSWLELARAPNLLTAWGDPAAGALLAGAWSANTGSSLVRAVGAVLCLYASGMILNDFADHRIDARERPSRPIPSRRIRPNAAATAGAILWLSGCALGLSGTLPSAALVMALGVQVLLYDFMLKPTRLAPAGMGLCRGLSVLAGAGAVTRRPAPEAYVFAVLIAGYAVAVTMLSRKETSKEEYWTPDRIGWLIGLFPLLQAAASALALDAGRSRWILVAAMGLSAVLHAVLRRRMKAS